MITRQITQRLSTTILWLLIAAYAAVTVIPDAFPRIFASPFNVPAAVLLSLCFGLIHGAIRYGIGGIAVFLALCLGISNVMENIGVLTGFPFGHYHYTDVLGPKLFLVPLLIGPAYFGTGYLSWVLANVLLCTDRRRDRLPTFVVPLIAAFIMVGWDLCFDPAASTIAHMWIWENGGGYFGVPLTNFLGWYLTVYIFLQLFASARTARDRFAAARLLVSTLCHVCRDGAGLSGGTLWGEECCGYGRDRPGLASGRHRRDRRHREPMHHAVRRLCELRSRSIAQGAD